MQWYKNKILISSAVYAASLAVVATIFGMWHNFRLQAEIGEYMVFIILIILSVAFLTWFYFLIFKISRKENNAYESMEQIVASDLETQVSKPEVSLNDNFDGEGFIGAITLSNKKSLPEYCESILLNLADKLNIVQGLFYIKSKSDDTFEPVARYAYYSDQAPPVFRIGESLPGQAVKDKRVLIIQNVPEGYIPVVSGLGSGKPKNLVMIPVTIDNEPVGLIEIAIFTTVDANLEPALKELGGIIGKNIVKLTK